MDFYCPAEVLNMSGDKAQMKKKLPFPRLFLLSVIGGSFIAQGFLACIRVQGTMPVHWGSFATFLGGCLFPIGLMGIVLVGGELATGNMMTMAVANLKISDPPMVALVFALPCFWMYGQKEDAKKE